MLQILTESPIIRANQGFSLVSGTRWADSYLIVEKAMEDWKENRVPRDLRRHTLSAVAAATLLSQKQPLANLPQLLHLLKHTDPVVRKGTIRNLAQIRDSTALAGVARALNDPDPEVRVTVCQALGQARAHSHRAGLYDALVDTQAQVRCAAAVALRQMGDHSGLPAVAKLVCLPGPHRWDSLRALNAVADKDFSLNQAGLEDAVKWIRFNQHRFA